MAILSKIREKTVFLILIIGLALFAFVIQEALGKGGGNTGAEVGSIAGETISREDYQRRVEQYQASTGGRSQGLQAENAVWNSLLREKVYAQQLKNAGIVVGEEDVWNEIITSPSMTNNATFKNEAGIFDPQLVEQYIAETKEAAEDPKDLQAQTQWNNWVNYEQAIKRNLEQSIYDELVKGGLYGTLNEGEREHLLKGSSVSGKYVYLPYSQIADSTVTVSDNEIASYIKANPADFRVDASRDIKFVKFDVVASEEDKLAIASELENLNNDNKVKGFPIGFANISLDKVDEFVEDSNSDLTNDTNYKTKATLKGIAADTLMKMSVGQVFGPYEENGYYKLEKVLEKRSLPDSVRARHILLTAKNGESDDVLKQRADSVLAVIKKDRSKFKTLVKELSDDPGSIEKEGVYDWFPYNRMVPSFRDFCFLGKVNDLGIAKTTYGYHIIEVLKQKDFQTAIKTVSIARLIIPSEITENKGYEDAELFATGIANGTAMETLAKDSNYDIKNAYGLKKREENVAGLNKQRQIILWAHEAAREVGDFKRFDLDAGGYVVVQLTGITFKGLASVRSQASKVRPILIKEKKATTLKARLNGASLDEMATNNDVKVKTISNISLESPTIPGVGKEAGVVGAMSLAPLDTLVNGVEGDKGVFAFVVSAQNDALALPNYAAKRNEQTDKLQRSAAQLFNALKDNTEIEDMR